MASIRDLVEGIPPGARADVAKILYHVAHALNTPLSTFTMDVFSAQVLIARAAEAARAGSEEAEPLVELSEVCANLRQASCQLAEMSAELSELAAAAVRTIPRQV